MWYLGFCLIHFNGALALLLDSGYLRGSSGECAWFSHFQSFLCDSSLSCFDGSLALISSLCLHDLSDSHSLGPFPDRSQCPCRLQGMIFLQPARCLLLFSSGSLHPPCAIDWPPPLFFIFLCCKCLWIFFNLSDRPGCFSALGLSY